MADLRSVTIELNVRVRWWVMPYLRSLVLFCETFGTWPDSDKVCAFILKHGVVVYANGKRL